MCEIATIPVDQFDPEEDDRATHVSRVVELASAFYDDNPHGLGVVATKRDESENAFTHEAFKTGWTDKGMSTTALYEFVDERLDDAWRFTVHARFATAGEVDRKGTHPIIIDNCDETPWDAVVHNGSIRGHKYKRRRLKKDGHTFSTEVDSEVIAHETDLPDPDTFGSEEDDWGVPNLRGNLNYLLFHEDMILVYTEGKYHVSDDFTMACNFRDFNTDKPTQGEEGWFLFTPDGDVVFREMEKPTISARSGGHSKWSGLSRSSNPWKGHSFDTRSAQSRLDTAHSDDPDDESGSNTDSGNSNRKSGVDSPRGYASGSDEPEQTRETLRRAKHESNPTIGSDEALPQSEHAGYFVGADEMFCLEHETVFSYVCTECSTDLKKDESEQVGLVFRPDIFPGAQPHKGEVNTAKGTRSVTRCSMSMEWYVGEVCPTCGVDHNASRAYPR